MGGKVWIIPAFVLFLFIAASAAALASECNDHIDNNGNGYCDFAAPGAYCQDGSVLGDPNCINTDSYETVSCVPSNEVCDAIDNNCNGFIDENLTQTQSCGSNVGECRYGTESRHCAAGEWSPWGGCTGGVNPTREVCGDGKDNDCDGVVDNGCATTGQIANQNGEAIPATYILLGIIVIIAVITLTAMAMKRGGE